MAYTGFLFSFICDFFSQEVNLSSMTSVDIFQITNLMHTSFIL